MSRQTITSNPTVSYLEVKGHLDIRGFPVHISSMSVTFRFKQKCRSVDERKIVLYHGSSEWGFTACNTTQTLAIYPQDWNDVQWEKQAGPRSPVPPAAATCITPPHLIVSCVTLSLKQRRKGPAPPSPRAQENDLECILRGRLGGTRH